jgi:threonine dehydrogenase-like Zn-dependent dehydrogenase
MQASSSATHSLWMAATRHAERWGSTMQGAVLYRPGDVRFEERAAPAIIKPTDAIIRISATCVCGSDLWPYRGLPATTEPTPMGHEYCGIVEEVGSAVRSVRPGQFVIGSFFASDNTCPHCQAGYQTSCQGIRRWRPGAGATCPACRRHLGGHPGGPHRRHAAESVGRL